MTKIIWLLAILGVAILMIGATSGAQAKTVNYVAQIITNDQTSWKADIELTDFNRTGPQNYTLACSTTIAPIGYYVTAKITSSADNPPSLTLNLLYNGRIVNSTTVHDDFVDATIENTGCPSVK